MSLARGGARGTGQSHTWLPEKRKRDVVLDLELGYTSDSVVLTNPSMPSITWSTRSSLSASPARAGRGRAVGEEGALQLIVLHVSSVQINTFLKDIILKQTLSVSRGVSTAVPVQLRIQEVLNVRRGTYGILESQVHPG